MHKRTNGARKLVRITPDNHNALSKLKKSSRLKLTIPALVNEAIRLGMDTLENELIKIEK